MRNQAVSAIRIGTSSWSSGDWKGPFYPPGTNSADFLSWYATRFDTVECDATFYHVPRVSTVEGWERKTPPGFLFSAKLPKAITHDAGLVDCDDEVQRFVHTMSHLRSKLGPLLAQFPYIAKGRDPEEYAHGGGFIGRLKCFLERWPTDFDLVVEVRNTRWLAAPLLDLLREHNVSLAISVYYTMPGPERWTEDRNVLTGPWAYARFLGNHRQMDKIVEEQLGRGERDALWSSFAVDRSAEMRRWVRPLAAAAEDGIQTVAYFNNHYAGFGPASATLFTRLWDEIVGA